MIVDPTDDPIEAAIRKAKAAIAAQQAAATQATPTPSNPRTGQMPHPTFAAESSGVSTAPRKAGDVGVIDPLGMGAHALQGAGMQFADEAAGLIGGAVSKVRGGTFGEGYDATRGAFTRVADTYKANHPVAAMGAEVVGAAAPMLATMGGSGAAQAGASTVGAVAKAGARAGAKYGAVAGVGSGEDALDRVGKGLIGAGAGYALGGALSALPVAAVRAPSAIAARVEEAMPGSAVARGLSALARKTDAVTDRIGGAVAGWLDQSAAPRVEAPAIPTRTRQAMDVLARRNPDVQPLLAKAEANAADGSPEMLATLLDPNAQRTLRAADALSENGRTRAALDARTRQQGPNLARQVDGPEITPSIDIPRFKATAQEKAGPIFDAAHAAPALDAPEVNTMLETPFGRQLYETARRRASNDLRWRADLPSAEELAARPAQAANEAAQRVLHGADPVPPIPRTLPPHIEEAANLARAEMLKTGAEMTPDLERRLVGAAIAADEASTRAKGTFEPKVLHWMKIAADDAVEGAMTNSERTLADQYRRGLLDVLRRDDTMAQALDAYHVPMSQGEAVSTAFSGDGARSLPGVLNAPPRAVKAELSRLQRDVTPEAAQSYRDSGKQAVRDYLAKVRPDRDVTKTLFPDGPKDELVQALLDAPNAAAFGRQLEREQAVGAARDNILGNSSTARNQQDIRLLGEQANAGMLPLSNRGTTMLEDVARSGSLRQPLKARAADFLANRRIAKTKAVADELDRLGALSNTELSDMLNLWAQRQRAVYQPLGVSARATGRIVGATRQ